MRDVAESIADHRPVDWDGVMGLGSTREIPGRSLDLEHMRTIERAATVRRQGLYRDVAALAASAAASETEPLFRWGRLDVLERIGGGSYADVYRAFHRDLEREVALKMSRAPETTLFQRGFLAESRKLARVEHPNVVFVHGCAQHDGRAGFWTDLIRGRTLAERIAQEGPLSAAEAAQVGIDLCGALAALHAQGLVHCDLKPANVMREHGGRTVLTDFGSAEYVREDGASLARAVSGTPLTMAPEVLVDEQEPTRASDIYGLGALLYWLVSGRYPVEAETIEDLVAKHERGERVPLVDVRHEIPVWYAAVVERALSRDPAARFESVGHMQRALRAGAEPGPTPAGVAWARWQARLQQHRKAIAWSGGVVAVLAAAAAVVQMGFAAPRLDVSFFRAAAAGNELLVDGSRVGATDEVFLELRGSRPMHVWVLNEDSHGDAHVLYPLAAAPAPLPSGRVHRLPSDSNWVISDVGGAETIALVVSRRPLPELQQLLSAVPRVAVGHATPPPAPGPGFRSVDQQPRLLEPSAPKLVGEVQRRFGQRFGVVVTRVRLTREDAR